MKAGSNFRVRASSVTISVALHLALAGALARSHDAPMVPPLAPIRVTLIDSAGESSVPMPPRPKQIAKVAKAAPKEINPQRSPAPEQVVPVPSESVASETSDDTPASPASITLPRFNAHYLNNPAPVYPSAARRTGEQGRVVLEVVVRADGTPDQVRISRSSGSSTLDQAALEAVRKWRFIPAREGDTAVVAAVLVPISFTLRG